MQTVIANHRHNALTHTHTHTHTHNLGLLPMATERLVASALLMRSVSAARHSIRQSRSKWYQLTVRPRCRRCSPSPLSLPLLLRHCDGRHRHRPSRHRWWSSLRTWRRVAYRHDWTNDGPPPQSLPCETGLPLQSLPCEAAGVHLNRHQ